MYDVARLVVLLRPCTTSAGFTATPEHPRRVNMIALRESLRDAGYEVVVDARVLLLVRRDIESSIYTSGKVIMKTRDAAVARQAYDALRPHLEAAWE